MPAADHQTIKLHCCCMSSDCLQLCMRLSRYMSAAKHHDIKLHVSLQQIIELQVAYLQQIQKTAKTNCSSSSNCLQLIIQNNQIALLLHVIQLSAAVHQIIKISQIITNSSLQSPNLANHYQFIAATTRSRKSLPIYRNSLLAFRFSAEPRGRRRISEKKAASSVAVTTV